MANEDIYLVTVSLFSNAGNITKRYEINTAQQQQRQQVQQKQQQGQQQQQEVDDRLRDLDHWLVSAEALLSSFKVTPSDFKLFEQRVEDHKVSRIMID